MNLSPASSRNQRMKNPSLLHTSPYTIRQKGLLALLGATYLAGIVGLLLPQTTRLFQALTPFNLILSAGILLYFHRHWNRPFILFCILSFLTGYFAEVAGVATGLIFGSYYYGPTLGWQLLEVPLIIGLNWFMLIYSTGTICAQLKIPLVLKAMLASGLMVVLDLFIEPVAVAFDFWQWENDVIPWQNYAAWFIISVGLHLLFFLLPFQKGNRAAKFLYLLQLIFFVILCLFTIY